MRSPYHPFIIQHPHATSILSLPVQARDETSFDLYARGIDDELVERALGNHGTIGRKGGPRKTGSLPHKPPKEGHLRREVDDLVVRELVEELLARGHVMMPSNIDVSWGPESPVARRMKRLGRSHIHRREDDSLWMCAELDELD